MKSIIKPVLTAFCMMIGASAFAQNVTPTDRKFVAKVSQGGMYEVAAGRLAMIKGATQDVRDFATAEVHDHQLVGDKLKRLAGQFGMGMNPGLNPYFSAKLRRLESTPGPMFDRAYLADMDDLHGIDGAAFADEARNGGPQPLRAFGAETHRIVMRHIGAIRAVPAQ